jgi:hypothetical protein
MTILPFGHPLFTNFDAELNAYLATASASSALRSPLIYMLKWLNGFPLYYYIWDFVSDLYFVVATMFLQQTLAVGNESI